MVKENRDFKKEMKQAKLLMNIGILVVIVGGVSSIIVTILFLLGVVKG
jgi:hypothetical protein